LRLRRRGDRDWSRLLQALETISGVYDALNAVMGLGIDFDVRVRAVRAAAGLAGEGRGVFVDLGSGPGTSALAMLEAAKPSYLVLVDPSPRLLGVNKAYAVRPELCDRVVGVMEALPLRSRVADVAASFFVLRDVVDLEEALRESFRVARVILHVDLFKPWWMAQRVAMYGWFCIFIPLVGGLVGKMSSYLELCRTLIYWHGVEELAPLCPGAAAYTSLDPIGFSYGLLCLSETQKSGVSQTVTRDTR